METKEEEGRCMRHMWQCQKGYRVQCHKEASIGVQEPDLKYVSVTKETWYRG
jgi:hypothetical protein